MAASVAAFVAYIAVAGLGKANELAGVVSALVALAGLGLAVGGLAWGRRETGKPIVKAVAGSPPWTIKGHGITYKVLNVTRGTRARQGRSRRIIVITAYVTRTQSSGISKLEYEFHDEESSKSSIR